MRIEFHRKEPWPKLAWVAEICPQSEHCMVHHGPLVEVRDDWAVEGVWDADFEAGNFDLTDTHFGTGIRKRNDEIVFVSSSTGVDRLWYVKSGDTYFVSNTLPGLLRISGLNLRNDYEFYTEDLITVQKISVFNHVKAIPTDKENLQVVYLRNVLYRDGQISEIDKPDCAPHFSAFTEYEDFLKSVAARLGDNARAVSRNWPIDMLVGLSSGYDSIAAAVISQYAGCCKAASITNPSSFWRGSDSGKRIADRLGMTCKLYRHAKENYRNEITLWAGAGIPGARNLSLFNYPKPLCLFFSGGYGDIMWDRKIKRKIDPRGGINELLCEFRLIEGVFVSVVPWWGIRRSEEIRMINGSEEMSPWVLGTDYDRPIARRIIEEAGIPRGEFATRKKNTSSTRPLRWPSTEEARNSFERFLRQHGLLVPGPVRVKIFGWISQLANLTYQNIGKPLKVKKWWKPWLNFPGRTQLFVWANHDLRDRYYRDR